MTDKLKHAIGKHFLVEISGTSISDDEKYDLERLQPGAIMLRKRNFLQNVDYDTWLQSHRKLIADFRSILAKDLILSIDHEGGRVIRPPDPITKFPYAINWPDKANEVAQAMAKELKSLAINVNFAPVADIHTNEKNPVINERAFGTTAQQVSKACIEFARTLKNNGISPCAKHFPGHGDTETDSHFGLPKLDLNLEQLRKRELVPFKKLIDDGISMIMTAHILLPKIDPVNTATLSHKILHDILRNEMGFKGIIIADALGMGAISQTINREESLVKAVQAGLDIFLMAGDNVTLKDAVHMAELFCQAVEAGKIDQECLHKSQNRIKKFVSKLPHHSVCKLNKSVLAQHEKLAKSLEKAQTKREFDLNLPGFE